MLWLGIFIMWGVMAQGGLHTTSGSEPKVGTSCKKIG